MPQAIDGWYACNWNSGAEKIFFHEVICLVKSLVADTFDSILQEVVELFIRLRAKDISAKHSASNSLKIYSKHPKTFLMFTFCRV